MAARRKYDKEALKEALETSRSIRQALLKIGLVPAGGNYATAHSLIDGMGIDITHMTHQGWNTADIAGLLRRNIIPLEEILVAESDYRGGSNLLRKRLVSHGFKKEFCEKCFRRTWNGKPIPLELEHVNGINTDNRLVSLKLLCPNCHAQTSTYRGRNKRRS